MYSVGILRMWGRVISIETTSRGGQFGFRIRKVGRDCYLLQESLRVFRAHSASCAVGDGEFSPVLLGGGREANHSPTCSAKIKNGGAIHLLALYAFRA